MKSTMLKIGTIVSLIICVACTQNKATEPEVNKSIDTEEQVQEQDYKYKTVKVPTHRYGGWYCPDNLRGFPPVDIANWKNVPVINGRLATEKETKSEASLIHIDIEKYPNAKTLDIAMPKLATFNSPYTDRQEIIIVIQALNIDNDSIVGFRYLNGGNGSARLSEVHLLSDKEANKIEKSKFFKHSFVIMASPEKVKETLTLTNNASKFREIIAMNSGVPNDWRSKTNVNYSYAGAGELTSSYGDMLFGNFYIQNDYENFTEKFLVTQNEITKMSVLEVVCGPFTDDFEQQEGVLLKWGKLVQLLSEVN